jgi:hypothetical protein
MNREATGNSSESKGRRMRRNPSALVIAPLKLLIRGDRLRRRWEVIRVHGKGVLRLRLRRLGRGNVTRDGSGRSGWGNDELFHETGAHERSGGFRLSSPLLNRRWRWGCGTWECSHKLKPSLCAKEVGLPKVAHVTRVSMEHGHRIGPRSGNAPFPWVKGFMAWICRSTLLEHRGARHAASPGVVTADGNEAFPLPGPAAIRWASRYA